MNTTIRTARLGGLVSVTVDGELDLFTASSLIEAVAVALKLTDLLVVLDTTELTFIDVTGRRALQRATTAAHARGVGLVVVPGPALRHFDDRVTHPSDPAAHAA